LTLDSGVAYNLIGNRIGKRHRITHVLAVSRRLVRCLVVIFTMERRYVETEEVNIDTNKKNTAFSRLRLGMV
jgi:hypothetical protein